MRLFTAFLTSLFVLLAMAGPVFAEQRSAGNFSAASSSSAAAEWLRYYKGEGTPSFAAISKFMAAHPDFPAQSRLREVAERAMPSDIPDAAALDWFANNPPVTTFGMKTYADALKRAGRGNEASKKINDWWRETLLTPADQSKAYAAFSSALDKSAHRDRLRMLIYKQQYTNARKIAELLGAGYVALAEARISMQAGKDNPNAYISRIPPSLMNDEGLLFNRLVYRRKADSNDGAIEILNNQPAFESLYDADGWGKERGIIVRRLFEEKKYSAAYRLAANNKLKSGAGFANNEWMAGWLALEFLKKPYEAFEHFERLYHGVETPISKSRAAFWAGLASERLKRPDVARQWYEVGAKFSTTFYGQLSSQKLGRDDKIVSASAAANGAVKNSALASSARWLKQRGYKMESLMFLNAMMDQAGTTADYAAIADLANSIGLPNAAIRAAQECEKKNGMMMVGYAFPKIESYMKQDQVEWALVHALVRQESRYDQEAVSSAGARGLMQLMPATAKEVARKAGISHNTSWLTSKPAHNVDLGTRYLKSLLDRYNGNYPMALAAYNAGPSIVTQWVQEFGDPRDPKINAVNWIESIPIYETRNYVQRVLEGVYVYRQTLSRNKGQTSEGVHLALQ